MTDLLQEMQPIYSSPPEELFRFSIERYHEMVELGLFTPEDNIELLNGQAVGFHNKLPLAMPHIRSIIG